MQFICRSQQQTFSNFCESNTIKLNITLSSILTLKASAILTLEGQESEPQPVSYTVSSCIGIGGYTQGPKLATGRTVIHIRKFDVLTIR